MIRSALAQYAYDGDGQRVGSAAPTYLLVDHLGSTRYVLDNSAQTLSAQRYFPWGSTHFASDANALPRRQYTGQMNDTDLYYYNARYYEPGLARFIQADTIVPGSRALTISPNDKVAAKLFYAEDKPENLLPLSPQDLNRYTYSANSPVVKNDPSGHCWWIASGARNLQYGEYGMGTNCANIDMAWAILWHPDATPEQKSYAANYLGLWGVAGVSLAGGGAAYACSAVAPCVAAIELGGAACADGDCTNEVGIAQQILREVTKPQVREYIAKATDFTQAQVQRIRSILGSGRIDAVTVNRLNDGTVQVIARRGGVVSGWQEMVYTFNDAGKFVGIFQYVYDNSGVIIHIHDKLNNIVIK